MRSPDCDASGEEEESQLKVRVCPLKIPRPTKTSLARQAQIRASSDVSGSDSEVTQTRPRRGRKKGSKNSPLLPPPGMESGQGDLDASTIAKRLRVRKEMQPEPSGSKVDTKPSSTSSDETSTEVSSSEREASEEPPVPPISLRDRSLMPSLVETTAEATDEEIPGGSERGSDSSSEEEANKTVIESKDCIDDDALNASTHAASNDSSSSSSEGEMLPIFQSTMRRSAVPDDLLAKTNFSPKSKSKFVKEWNTTSLWWDSLKQQANESENNHWSIEEPEVPGEDPNAPAATEDDGELQISGDFEDISVPFIPRNAKSLPSSPVKPHEAIPLSEYGVRAEREEVPPELVQSWRTDTFLDADTSQVVPASESLSAQTGIRPLARSTPIPTTSPKSQ